MKAQCTNKPCGYQWDYKGLSRFYASCPRCLSKVKIHPSMEKEEQPDTKDLSKKSTNSSVLSRVNHTNRARGSEKSATCLHNNKRVEGGNK